MHTPTSVVSLELAVQHWLQVAQAAVEEAGYSMMTGSKEMPIHDHMGPGSDRIDLNDPNISLHMFTMIIQDLFFTI